MHRRSPPAAAWGARGASSGSPSLSGPAGILRRRSASPHHRQAASPDSPATSTARPPLAPAAASGSGGSSGGGGTPAWVLREQDTDVQDVLFELFAEGSGSPVVSQAEGEDGEPVYEAAIDIPLEAYRRLEPLLVSAEGSAAAAAPPRPQRARRRSGSAQPQQQQQQHPSPTPSPSPSPSPSGGGGGGVRPLSWLLKVLDGFYAYRGSTSTQQDLASSLFQFLGKKFGLDVLVRKAGKDLLDALKAYKTECLEVGTFGVWLTSGCYDDADAAYFFKTREAVLPLCAAAAAASPPHAGGRKVLPAHQVPRAVRKATASSALPPGLAGSVRRGLKACLAGEGAAPPPVALCPPFHNNPYVPQPEGLDDGDDGESSPRQAIPLGCFLAVCFLNYKYHRWQQEVRAVSGVSDQEAKQTSGFAPSRDVSGHIGDSEDEDNISFIPSPESACSANDAAAHNAGTYPAGDPLLELNRFGYSASPVHPPALPVHPTQPQPAQVFAPTPPAAEALTPAAPVHHWFSPQLRPQQPQCRDDRVADSSRLGTSGGGGGGGDRSFSRRDVSQHLMPQLLPETRRRPPADTELRMADLPSPGDPSAGRGGSGRSTIGPEALSYNTVMQGMSPQMCVGGSSPVSASSQPALDSRALASPELPEATDEAAEHAACASPAFVMRDPAAATPSPPSSQRAPPSRSRSRELEIEGQLKTLEAQVAEASERLRLFAASRSEEPLLARAGAGVLGGRGAAGDEAPPAPKPGRTALSGLDPNASPSRYQHLPDTTADSLSLSRLSPDRK